MDTAIDIDARASEACDTMSAAPPGGLLLQTQAALAGSVTILGAPRKVLTKRYSVGPMGQVIQSAYDRAKRFVRQTPGGAESIHDLYALLRQMEPHSQYCIIRGASIAGTNLKDTDRKLAKYGGQFEDVPRHWLMLDLDHVVLPPGTSLLQDPADAARAVLDLVAGHVPELAEVAAVVQFTSSAGIAELEQTARKLGPPSPYRWAEVWMAGAYSTDLRSRVLAAVEAGESPEMVAERFVVGRSTVYRWVAAVRDEGRRAAKRMGGGPPPAIRDEAEAVLRRMLSGSDNHLTLAECRDRLAAETGLRVHPWTVGRALRRLDWT